ncbi:hypothetical protein E2K98_10080 [Bacillus salipaludis]|uniref:ABC transmembrane type-1 domain-containing protein n=1 Tax=Bacillus salipaludis TaxID=2547811 RepID=A0A4R5VTY9_9BACI|nr:hypothetical protein [Bacillus salipaludis]TDK62388.1 hypothetical protein E2K98_10080 [Bacillus salipaludis]
MKIFKYKKTTFGLLILILILILSFLYPLYGPPDFNTTIILYDNKGKMIDVRPFSPSSHFLLGSDRNGADILLMIIYGAKYTILITFGITILRFLIGGVLGIIFSFWLNLLLPIVKNLFVVFRIIPPIIITLLLITATSTTYIKGAAPFIIVYQMIILVLIGIPSVLINTSDIISELKGKSFIQSSYLMGAGHFHIIKRHLKPYMTSYGLIIFVQQLLNTLVLIMFLGTFNIYMGGISAEGIAGTEQIGIGIGAHSVPAQDASLTREWSGLIGQNYREFYRVPWIILDPLFAYFFLILLINMMKKELEAGMDAHYTKKGRKYKNQDKSTDPILSPNFTFQNYKEIEK